MTQLLIKDLSLGYEGKVIAENLNFHVEKGDYLCIVGENGSGKTTLMKTLLNLLKPLGGTIHFTDRKQIGYLPQQTLIQKDFPASVKEVVLSGCLNRGGLRPFYTKAEKELARRNMERMGILELQNRCYRELSGGQQQRVLLARALSAAQDMILLDEPVAGLDPLVTQELYELIAKLNREENITIIMVSHDISAAVRYATKILHISREPLFFGTTEDYLQTPVGKAFIELGGGLK